MKILFITTRFPYPLYTGDRLRSYVQIKNLARDHEVTLVCFSNGAEPEHVEHLRTYCREIHVVRHRRIVGLFQAGWALLTGKLPLQVAYFYSRALARRVRDLLSAGSFDAVHVHMIRCGEYVRGRRDVVRIIDMCDALSLEFQRRVRHQKTWLLPVLRLEWPRLASYERELARDYDRVIMISPIDAASVSEAGNVDVLVNSVRMRPRLSAGVEQDPFSIIYTGYIGFYSDEIALIFFHDRVFPEVLKRVPGARLYIVGARPSARVRKMARDNVVVTGYVDSMEEYLGRAWVSVSPMQVGAGLKNKILEAFMYELPVVATTLANQGIGARHGEDILIADDPREFAEAVSSLLLDADLRARIGRNGRRYVEEHFSDDVVRDTLAAIYRRAFESRSSVGLAPKPTDD